MLRRSMQVTAGLIAVAIWCGGLSMRASATEPDDIRKYLEYLSVFDGSPKNTAETGLRIQSDCEFRYRDNFRYRDICIKNRNAGFMQMRDVYRSADNDQLLVIAVCMDNNKALSDYEWDSIPRCYERLIAEMR